MIRLLVGVVSLMPAMALAQDATEIHPYLGNRYFASIGIFRPDQEMRLGLDASVELPDPGPTPYLDFSETFDFKTSDQTFSAEIGWRFRDNWQLRGQYFDIENNNRLALEGDIEWGDYTFNAGTVVGAGTDMQITRLFFGRTFWSTNSREFGLGIGGHILDMAAYVNGNAMLNGQNAGFRQERASISQPLPNFGAWYMHALSRNWAATLRLDWLSASVGNYDGRIVNAAASVGYAIGDHFGVSLAYNHFEIALDIDDADWHGRAKVRFDGPYISLTGYW